MTKSLQTVKQEREAMQIEAEIMIKGGAISRDCKTVPQAMMKIATGRDMGLTASQALNYLYIVNGQVQAWGKGMGYLLRQAGWKYTFDDRKDECTITISKDDEEYSDTAKFSNAVQSGYTHGSQNGKRYLKVGWKEGQNRLLKLRYMAMSMVIKTYVAEVLGGATDIVEIAEDVDLDAPIKEIKAEDVKTYKTGVEKAKKKAEKVLEGEIVKEIESAEVDQAMLGTVHRRYIDYCGEQGMDYDDAVKKIEDATGQKFEEISSQDVTRFVNNILKKMEK